MACLEKQGGESNRQVRRTGLEWRHYDVSRSHCTSDRAIDVEGDDREARRTNKSCRSVDDGGRHGVHFHTARTLHRQRAVVAVMVRSRADR